MLEIEVVEVRGKCPVYKVGDKITIDGPRIVLEKTDALCIHARSITSTLPIRLCTNRNIIPKEEDLTPLERLALSIG